MTLQDIGIPIQSEIGRYGGYAIRPGFKLPPPMFTDDEVLGIATYDTHTGFSDSIGPSTSPCWK
jgi:predicted DNA-binding transcriptional regulator YafY